MSINQTECWEDMFTGEILRILWAESNKSGYPIAFLFPCQGHLLTWQSDDIIWQRQFLAPCLLHLNPRGWILHISTLCFTSVFLFQCFLPDSGDDTQYYYSKNDYYFLCFPFVAHKHPDKLTTEQSHHLSGCCFL